MVRDAAPLVLEPQEPMRRCWIARWRSSRSNSGPSTPSARSAQRPNNVTGCIAPSARVRPLCIATVGV